MAKPTRKKRNTLNKTRIGIQLGFFILFVYITLALIYGWRSPLPPETFLRLNPLSWAVSSLAAFTIASYGLMALGLIVVTFILGRVFCGWVCPLGTAIDFVGYFRRRRPILPLSSKWLRLRFWILFGLIGAAFFHLNLTGWVDPLVMSNRALHVLGGASEGWLAVVFAMGLPLAAIGLTILAPRFWCRTLCPLGALLSLPARFARYHRVTQEFCNDCGLCTRACPLDNPPESYSPDNCLVCQACKSACNRDGIEFGFSSSPSEPTNSSDSSARHFPLSRRQWIGSLLVGGVAGILLRPRSAQAVLRPPGATPEERFTAQCVACGTCLSVCPTGILHPMLRADRPDGLFTPQLFTEVGACLPECTACGDVCPTGAIPRITQDRKRFYRIGLADIDPSICLYWAEGRRCQICRSVCQNAYQAIEHRPSPQGELRPYVIADRCTGCGLCQQSCPVDAIQVMALNESESGLFAEEP